MWGKEEIAMEECKGSSSEVKGLAWSLGMFARVSIDDFEKIRHLILG